MSTKTQRVINLHSDNDIKIVGDKPSRDVKRNKEAPSGVNGPDKATAEKARNWGKTVALEFISDVKNATASEENSYGEMLMQRRLLLSFTATVGFEQFVKDDTVSGIAQKSFIDTVRNADNELYRTSGDTGAFSFYYLAFRRGGEVDRRIGQTFAMLCSHDGDPIYQELGEALYCWFLSVVKRTAEEFELS